MSRHVDAYEVDPIETRHERSALEPAEEKGLELLVSHVLTAYELQWVDGFGYVGLDKLVTSSLGRFVPPSCPRVEEGGCLCEIEYHSGEGQRGADRAIVLRRPGGSFATEEEATTFEGEQRESCLHQQDHVQAEILEWLGALPGAVQLIEQKLDKAQEAVEKAKQELNGLFGLGAQGL